MLLDATIVSTFIRSRNLPFFLEIDLGMVHVHDKYAGIQK